MGFALVQAKPTITTDAYTALDQVGGVQTLTGVAAKAGGVTKLVSVAVIDRAQQKAVLELWFFRRSPTMVGVDNGAFDITDAELEKAIGYVAVAAADYKDAASSGSLASIKNIQMVCDSADGNVYVVAKTTGTPTYAVGDLTFKYGFETVPAKDA